MYWLIHFRCHIIALLTFDYTVFYKNNLIKTLRLKFFQKENNFRLTWGWDYAKYDSFFRISIMWYCEQNFKLYKYSVFFTKCTITTVVWKSLTFCATYQQLRNAKYVIKLSLQIWHMMQVMQISNKNKKVHFLTVSALKNKNTRPQIDFSGYYISKKKV